MIIKYLGLALSDRTQLILLKIVCSTDILEVDATYEIIWQGLPVFLGLQTETANFTHIVLRGSTNKLQEIFRRLLVDLTRKS